MKRKTFEYFDYEPSEHRADSRDVILSIITLVILFAGIVIVA